MCDKYEMSNAVHYILLVTHQHVFVTAYRCAPYLNKVKTSLTTPENSLFGRKYKTELKKWSLNALL